MNRRRDLRGIIRAAAGALTLCVLSNAAFAAAPVYDMDSDGAVTVYDYVAKKREALENPDGTAADEAAVIADFLSGRGEIPQDHGGETPGTVYTGKCTWYNGGITSGRCGLQPIPEGIYVCAVNNVDYAEGLLAGAYLRVTAENGNSVDVLVTDTSGQGSGDLDLNVSAFEQLAQRGMGVLNITWQIIPYPNAGGVQIRYAASGSQYYASFQVLGHTYPIAQLEILSAAGTWEPVTHRSDNYFVMSGAGAGPFTFRLTDIYGQQFTAENVPLAVGETVQCSGNFPAIPEN